HYCREIRNITGDFVDNSATMGVGGAIYNSTNSGNSTGSIGDIVGNFIGNSANGAGAILNTSGYKDSTASIGNITGDFIGNTATNGSAGAIGNSATDYRGSVAKIGNITGDFIANSAKSEDMVWGGAIANMAGRFGAIKGDFVGNSVENTSETFFKNETYPRVEGSYAAGGAVANLVNNRGYGGYYYTTPIIELLNGANYQGNFAKANAGHALGGAIYNEGYIKEVSDITFIDNYVSSVSGNAYGGAIYNGTGLPTNGAAGSYGDSYSNISEVIYIDMTIVNEDSSIYKSVYMYVAIIDNQEVYLTENNLEDIISDGTVENFTYYGNWGTISKSEFDAMLEQEGVSEEEWFNEMSQYGYILSSPDELLEMYSSDVMPTLEKVQNLKPNITLKNSNLIGNHAESVTGEAKGGAIYNKKSTIKIAADNGETSYISGNYTKNGEVIDDNAIYMEGGKLIFDVTNGSTIQVDDNIDGENYSTYIIGDEQSKFVLNNKIKNARVHLFDTNLVLCNDNNLDGNVLGLHSGTLSMVNNQTGVSALDTLTITGDTNFVADVDLANSTMDRFEAA
ncbi:MAG: hypothetical protein ACI37Q_07335, partial [Candidatus Gastranaerophilaceae bacterium]